MTATDVAISLARGGWGVFPVRLTYDADAGKWVKAPAHRSPANDPENRDRRLPWTAAQRASCPPWQDVDKGGFHQAAWRPEDALALFSQCRRSRLVVGAVHGGVACIDIDRAAPAPAGLLRRMRAAGACVVESLGGGRHFLFRLRPESALAGPGSSALEHRGVGFGDLKMAGGLRGYAVAPPVRAARTCFPALGPAACPDVWPETGVVVAPLVVDHGYRVEGDEDDDGGRAWTQTYPPVSKLRLLPADLDAEIASCIRSARGRAADGRAGRPAARGRAAAGRVDAGCAWTRSESPSTFAARRLAGIRVDGIGGREKRLGGGHWIHNAVCAGVVAPLVRGGGWTTAAAAVVREWWAALDGPPDKIDGMVQWSRETTHAAS